MRVHLSAPLPSLICALGIVFDPGKHVGVLRQHVSVVGSHHQTDRGLIEVIERVDVLPAGPLISAFSTSTVVPVSS